jgi:hypothetical protein
MRSAPLRVEPAELCEFTGTADSVEHLNAYPYIKHVENIAESQFQPQLPPVTRQEL